MNFRTAPRRLRGTFRFTIATAVTALLSIGVMAPYLGDQIYQNGDLWNFLGGVVEARNALAEGQFPIRVAPNQLDGQRYPVFQFYANLPYTVAGLIMGDDGRNPYAAWKWTMFAALMLGGLSVWRLAWRWTRSQPAALSAIAVFLSAPYLLTDLNDRGAVSEAIAICLLPAALLATWTCLTRRGWWRVAVCAVAWTAIGLSHNITYLYGATLLGLFILSFVRFRRRFVPRVGRLVAAGILHLMLIAWYVAPQIALMPNLAISTGVASPTWSSVLVPLKVLLWPVCRTPEVSTIPRLGLQVGWLIIASVVLGALTTWSRRRPPAWTLQRPGLAIRSSLHRGLSTRLLAFWIVTFFIVWSPVDLWSVVPKLFYFVQFTYRLLGFTILFGALLAAVGIAALLPRRSSNRWKLATMAVVAVAAATTLLAYFPHGQYHPRGAHRWINDRPQLGGLGDYVLRAADEPPLPAGMDRVVIEPWQPDDSDRKAANAPEPVFRASLPRPTRLILPVLWYPRMLQVDANRRPIPYGVSGRHVTVDLPAGQHLVTVQYTGLTWANQLSAAGAFITLGILGWRLGGVVRRRRT